MNHSPPINSSGSNVQSKVLQSQEEWVATAGKIALVIGGILLFGFFSLLIGPVIPIIFVVVLLTMADRSQSDRWYHPFIVIFNRSAHGVDHVRVGGGHMGDQPIYRDNNVHTTAYIGRTYGETGSQPRGNIPNLNPRNQPQQHVRVDGEHFGGQPIFREDAPPQHPPLQQHMGVRGGHIGGQPVFRENVPPPQQPPPQQNVIRGGGHMGGRPVTREEVNNPNPTENVPVAQRRKRGF